MSAFATRFVVNHQPVATAPGSLFVHPSQSECLTNINRTHLQCRPTLMLGFAHPDAKSPADSRNC